MDELKGIDKANRVGMALRANFPNNIITTIYSYQFEHFSVCVGTVKESKGLIEMNRAKFEATGINYLISNLSYQIREILGE